MTSNLAMNKLADSCQNCGILDDLEFFEFVLGGITLCQDCAELSVKKIQKKNSSINWVKVDGEYFPPDYSIAKKANK